MANPAHRWRAFALLGVAYFVTIADLAIENVALPTIGIKLHVSESNLQRSVPLQEAVEAVTAPASA